MARAVAASQRRCRDEGPNLRDLSSAQEIWRVLQRATFFVVVPLLLCIYIWYGFHSCIPFGAMEAAVEHTVSSKQTGRQQCP